MTNDGNGSPLVSCKWGLYIILDAGISGLPHVEATRQALAGGAKVIQLRDKAARFEDLISVGHELRELTRAAGATLIVNDNPYLAKEIDADGVHLGQSDFPVYLAREVLGPRAIVGLSTHTKQQALAAITQEVSYIAIGPVFTTTTKKTEHPPLGAGQISWIKKHTRIPLVAIGGITAATMPDVIAAGADNVAVISEVMGSGNIEAKVRELTQLLDKSRPA